MNSLRYIVIFLIMIYLPHLRIDSNLSNDLTYSYLFKIKIRFLFYCNIEVSYAQVNTVSRSYQYHLTRKLVQGNYGRHFCEENSFLFSLISQVKGMIPTVIPMMTQFYFELFFIIYGKYIFIILSISV